MRDVRQVAVDAPVTPPRGVSLLRYSPALVFLAIVVVDLSRMADPDLWWQLRFGQAVLTQRHLILRDSYSYSAPGNPWHNHEWLAEVLMAALYNAFGVVGLKLMKFACSATFVVLFVTAMQDTAPPLMQAAILLVCALPIAPHVQFRPQLFTFVMVSGLLAILARYNYRGRAPLWLVLPMFALWSNLHGGWIIGLGILGVFGSAVLAEDLADGRGMSRGASILGLTAAAAVATLANPYGIGAWQTVLHTLGNPHTHTAIVEWLPFPDSIAYHYRAHHYGSIILKFLAIAIFAAFALAVWRAPRGRDFPLVCVAVMTIAAAFVAVRNLPIALLATVIPLARHGAIALNSDLKPYRERPATIYQLMIAVTACELLFLSGLFSPKLDANAPYPVGAVAFMKQHGLTGNILAEWPFGAYVIWHMAPTSRVFMDGRYDTVYPMPVIDDYLAFDRGEPAGAATLSRYPHDFVLMEPIKTGAFDLVHSQGGWKELYRDSSCVLLGRGGSVAGITPTTVSAHDTPKTTFP